MLFLREALRIKLLRARRRRAGRRVAGFVIMAQARLAQRHAAGRAVRSDTLLSTVKSIQLSTVKSIQRGDFPTRRAAAARAAPSTPRLVSAARVGPVVYGLLLTFRGDGYGWCEFLTCPNSTCTRAITTVPWSIPPSGVARESSGPGGPLRYLLPLLS